MGSIVRHRPSSNSCLIRGLLPIIPAAFGSRHAVLIWTARAAAAGCVKWSPPRGGSAAINGGCFDQCGVCISERRVEAAAARQPSAAARHGPAPSEPLRHGTVSGGAGPGACLPGRRALTDPEDRPGAADRTDVSSESRDV